MHWKICLTVNVINAAVICEPEEAKVKTMDAGLFCLKTFVGIVIFVPKILNSAGFSELKIAQEGISAD